MLPQITFSEALDRTADRKRHLLLGNGFSIAAWESFRYEALASKICGQSARIDALFEQFDTKDFERIACALLDARKVLAVHEQSEAISQQLEQDYAELRTLLVQAIADIHPQTPTPLNEKFADCAEFLCNFIGGDRAISPGSVFSTNYDLLLYWTLMRGVERIGRFNDGFRGSPLSWLPEQTEQSVFYLHGALHLFEDDRATQKLTGETRLVGAVSRRIQSQDVPLFISEGASGQKRLRIEQSPYLRFASRRFEEACMDPEGCLFIFGHSLRDEDGHIFEKIAAGAVPQVFVSIRPADDSKSRNAARAAAQLWIEQRAEAGKPALEVFEYDPATAAPWGQ